MRFLYGMETELNEQDLKPGDLVQLKSGGPVMTYEGEGAMLGSALCVWFAGRVMQRERFDYAALKKAD